MSISIPSQGLLILLSLLTLTFVPNTPMVQIDAEYEMKTVIYALPYQFQETSYWTTDSYATQQWVNTIHAGLLNRNSTNRNWEPDLALNLPVISADNLTFTFDLKPDLIFENGQSLTADDVVFSYQMALTSSVNTNTYAQYSQYLQTSSITALDEDTIQIQLTSPYAFAYALFALPIVDQDSWTGKDGNVGTAGPFKLYSRTEDNIVVIRNSNYWDNSSTKLDQIIFTYISEKAVAISELDQGNIDLLDYTYMASPDELTLNNVKAVLNSANTHQEISLNHLHPYFGDGTLIPDNGTKIVSTDNTIQARYLRQAMSHIADRNTFVNDTYSGLGFPAATSMPLTAIGYDSSIEADSYNITLARDLMEKAGFNYSQLTYNETQDLYSTSFFDITVMTPNTNTARIAMTEAWTDELAKIGIGVNSLLITGYSTIIPRTFGWASSSLVPIYSNGGYDVLFVGYSWALDYDVSRIYESSGLCSTGDCSNFYNYQNTTVEQAIDEYRTDINETTRSQKASRLQKLLHEDLPIIPLVHGAESWGVYENVTGINYSLLSTGLQNWKHVDSDRFVTVVLTTSSTTTSSTQSSTTPSNSTIITTTVSNTTSQPETSVSTTPITSTMTDTTTTSTSTPAESSLESSTVTSSMEETTQSTEPSASDINISPVSMTVFLGVGVVEFYRRKNRKLT